MNLLKISCPIEFLDIDPFDSALLKYVAVEEKTVRAVTLYSKRLTRRLQITPSKIRLSFLLGELERIGIPSKEVPLISMEKATLL
jgi:hypothetical protein